MMELAIAVLVFGGAFVVLEVAFQVGRRSKPKEAPPQLATIQGAMLGLLGLLLGFSFSGATGRFIDRQDVLMREANAMGTAYLRADLLDEPHATALRNAVRSYCDARITLFQHQTDNDANSIRRSLADLQAAAWKAGVDGAKAAGGPAPGVVLPPLNEMFDLLATRDNMVQRHIPPLVLTLLCGCAAVSIGVIGYACGLQRKRGIGTVGAFATLVAVALWVTIDFDYPRRGVIQLSDQPLREVRAEMDPPPR
jgi:hypothetical protein